MPSVDALADYYSDSAVRLRIREYCGGSVDGAPTCMYLTALRGHEGPFATWDDAPYHAVSSLETLLNEKADLARSLWDSSNLLIHLDVDYDNVDVQGEPYHHPSEVFFKLEPVYRATRHVLHRFGLPLFTLMTGRGYHFTGRVPLASQTVDRIASLMPESPGWLQTAIARRPPWVATEITPRHARAYAGAGMLAEFLAHLIVRRARPRSLIPTVLNGTVVGNGLTGRECVSIDLSYAGDPMDVRHIRVAFGAYQKHRFRPDIVDGQAASARPPFIAIPRGGESVMHLLSHCREFRHAARAARRRSCVLPTVTEGADRLVTAYERSSLARFHRAFYATRARATDELEAVFRSVRLSALADCVTRPLLAPNDLLLQPAVVQHVTRALIAEGMKARDIAAVVHSRYVADCGWGPRWNWLDAQTRAEFDVRVFAGMVATGVDRAIDFNCRSAQEKGLCPGTGCVRDLRVDRARLLAKAVS